jgi:hypothetical protein
MFEIGEVFEGDLKFQAAPVSGIIREFQDRQKIEIIDVRNNIFTAKSFFFYDYDKQIYNSNKTAIGIYNSSNNKFKIIETLFQLPITLENKDNIEVSLLKGKKCKNAIHLQFLKSSNIPQNPGGQVVFAFDTKLKRVQ